MSLAEEIESELDAIVRDTMSAIWISRLDREIIAQRVANRLRAQAATPAVPDFEDLANRFVGIIQDGIALDAGSKSIASIIINELLALRIIGVAQTKPMSQLEGEAWERGYQHGLAVSSADRGGK